MEKIEIHESEKGISFFALHVDDREVSRMLVSVTPKILEAGYTSVAFDQRKNGYGKKLLNAVVEYARQNNLKIIPKCGFVDMVFNKYPQTYGDVHAKSK